jgi:hypothetical protein
MIPSILNFFMIGLHDDVAQFSRHPQSGNVYTVGSDAEVTFLRRQTVEIVIMYWHWGIVVAGMEAGHELGP